MTNTSKIILAVVIVLAVAGLAWWYFANEAAAPAGEYAPVSQTSGQTGGTAAGQGSNGDDSDAAIAKAMANVDAQMSGLSTDASSADQSMNDQPVSQI